MLCQRRIIGFDKENNVDMKLNRAAKGYFRTGYALFAENEELDEWEYTNGFGDTLSLILGKSYGIVLYDSESESKMDEATKRMYYVALTRAKKTEYVYAYDTLARPKIFKLIP